MTRNIRNYLSKIEFNSIFIYLNIFIAVIYAFTLLEDINLIDDNKDVNFTKELDLKASDVFVDENNLELNEDNIKKNKGKAKDDSSVSKEENIVKSKGSMTEFEHKMQKYMSAHMNELLSDLKKDITNSPDSSEKKNLEKIYQNEVDYKLEVDSLINKLEKELITDNGSPVNEDIQNKKRIAEKEVSDSKSKKQKGDNF